MEVAAEQQPLYTVLPEKRISVGAAMMGSAHVYDITSVNISVTIAVVSLLVTLKCKYSVDFRFIERLTVDHCHYFLLSEQKIYCFFFCFIGSCRCSKKSKFCHWLHVVATWITCIVTAYVVMTNQLTPFLLPGWSTSNWRCRGGTGPEWAGAGPGGYAGQVSSYAFLFAESPKLSFDCLNWFADPADWFTDLTPFSANYNQLWLASKLLFSQFWLVQFFGRVYN